MMGIERALMGLGDGWLTWYVPILASGFLAGWMLWWSLAGLIPIALHFWFQRQRREIPWAAMQFLLAALQKQSRRIRLQQLILLLIRVAILVLLAIATAQPFLSTQGAAWIGNTRPPLLWVGVLDTSYSMQYRDSSRQSRWEQAVTKARDMVEQLQPGDGIILMTLGNPPKVLFSEATFDRTSALLELAKLSPSARSADLATTVSVLEETLDANRRMHPELTSHQVVFFSDTAGDTWNNTPSSSLESTLRSLTKGAMLQLERVGDGKADNQAVTQLQVEASRPQQDREITLVAEIANFSPDSDVETSVQLWLDGQTIQSEVVQLSPRERKQVRFRQRFSDPKSYRLEARIADDSLPIDDRRHLVVTTAADAHIVFIEDLPGQAKYIELALSNRLASTPTSWQTTSDVVNVDDWRDLSLLDVDLVVLCNVSSLPEQLPNLLVDFVQRGGNLLGFLGDRIDPAEYQKLAQTTGTTSTGNNLFPWTLTSPAPLAIYPIDPRNYESPFLKIFKDFPDSGLLTTPIFRYWQLDDTKALPAKVRVDLSTQENAPLLLSFPFGNGNVAWWLTSPTPQPASIGDTEPWNAMAAWPSFLPLMREQVSQLTRPGENQTQRLIREPLRGYIKPEIVDEQITIVRPDRRADLVRPLPPLQDGFRPWLYDGNDVVGFYEAQASQSLGEAGQWFAVNVDTRESDLTSDGAQKYQSWFIPTGAAAVVQPSPTLDNPTSPSASTNDTASPSSQRQPLFHWFLGGLFGLLITESLVAFWLGRART